MKYAKLCLFLASIPLAACEFDEGINVHDLSGTVYVPKSAAPTADDVGMIYIGLYSGVDTHLGFPSPIAAPAASTAGADTFPYGGTSTGNFMSRDVRTICTQISGRTIRDDGTRWAIDFDVLQFPFYEGTNVWAWMDNFVITTAGQIVNTFTTCDGENGGYYSYYQIEVEPLSVEEEGVGYRVFLEETDLPVDDDGEDAIPGGANDRRYQDARGQHWQLGDVDVVNDSLLVYDIYSNGGKPVIDGPSQPIVFSYADLMYYGSQFQDVLNFPGKYVRGRSSSGGVRGDFVVQDPVVLENLSGDVEITIDYEVP